MENTFYQRPMVGGPAANIMLADDCKAKNYITTGVLVGIVVVGVVATVVTCPIEGAAVVAVAV